MTAEPAGAFWPDAPLADVRRLAASIASEAGSIASRLVALDLAFGELATLTTYAEFYSGDDDLDALADIGDAQRSLRSFARIARERAARTEQRP